MSGLTNCLKKSRTDCVRRFGWNSGGRAKGKISLYSGKKYKGPFRINWPKDHGQAVNIDDGLAPGQTGWWRGAWAIRTPHMMVDEGDGTYTIFFTGATTNNYHAGFRAMGKTTVRLIEE